MSRDELKEEIIKQILIIAPEIEEDEIEDDENIQTSLEIDSFDFLKILTALNESLGVEVPESDYAKVLSLNAMVEYFMERVK